jgi:hypothetical protein
VPQVITERGQQTATDVRAHAFATAALAARLPIGRGQLNNAFAIASLLMAAAVNERSSASAARLTAQAIAVGTLTTSPSPADSPDPNSLLDELADGWKYLDTAGKSRLMLAGGLIGEVLCIAERRAGTPAQHR